jgi:eukaryotic-like serine/threonine-protein kinase
MSNSEIQQFEKMQLRLERLEGPKSIASKTITKRGVLVVGRSSSSHIRLPKNEATQSRLHFVLEFNAPKGRLLDLGSRVGTYLNDKKIFSAYVVDGDIITAGIAKFQVRIGYDLETENTDDDAAYYALEQEREQKLKARKLKDKKHSKKKKEKTRAPKPEESNAEDEIDLTPAHKKGTSAAQVAKPTKTPVAATTSTAKPVEPVKKQPVEDKAQISFDLEKLLDGGSSEDLSGSTDQPPIPRDFVEEKSGPPEIPGYELIRSLGAGNLGEVYLATGPENKKFAIKLLHSERVYDDAAVKAFFKELEPLLELEHNHLVRYRDYGVAEDFIFIVSDYVEGVNSDQLLKNEGAMGVVRMAKLGCQLLHGLDYAHGLGHVHKDIKPSNIIITADKNREICLLSDFGLARAFQNSPLYGLKRKSDLERSVRFMAPEQFQNFKEMPISVDIYSIAATFYFLLTNKYTLDFESLSFDQAVAKIKRDDAVNINRRRMDVPGELANLIHSALQRFPQKRVASAAAFRRELYRFIK